MLWCGCRATGCDNLCCDKPVTDIDIDPAELRSVAERLATEAADFVRRRRAEVFGGAASAGVDRHGGARQEHADRPGHHRRHRNRTAAARPAGRAAARRACPRRGGRRRRAEVATGVRPGCSTRSTARSTSSTGSRPTRCRWGCRSTDSRWPARSPTSPTGAVYSAALGHGAHVRRDGVTTPLRCSPVDDLSMALVGTGFGY